jgi:hypothetical protein
MVAKETISDKTNESSERKGPYFVSVPAAVSLGWNRMKISSK